MLAASPRRQRGLGAIGRSGTDRRGVSVVVDMLADHRASPVILVAPGDTGSIRFCVRCRSTSKVSSVESKQRHRVRWIVSFPWAGHLADQEIPSSNTMSLPAHLLYSMRRRGRYLWITRWSSNPTRSRCRAPCRHDSNPVSRRRSTKRRVLVALATVSQHVAVFRPSDG